MSGHDTYIVVSLALPPTGALHLLMATGCTRVSLPPGSALSLGALYAPAGTIKFGTDWAPVRMGCLSMLTFAGMGKTAAVLLHTCIHKQVKCPALSSPPWQQLDVALLPEQAQARG